MSFTLRTCTRCARLYASDDGAEICENCQRQNWSAAITVDQAVEELGLTNVADIVTHTGLSTREVLDIVRSTSALREKVETSIVCERCKARGARADSRLCFECRLVMNTQLAEAAAKVLEHLQLTASNTAAQPVGAGGMNVAHLTRAKRDMTGMSRFDPTPRGKYG